MSARARRLASMLVALAVLGACARSSPHPSLRGSHLEVLAVWSGVEQTRFEEVLAAFRRATGVSVTYTPAGHRVADSLAERQAQGRLPDVAFIPQPGLLRQYVAAGLVAPVDQAVAAAVRRNYPAVWRDLGSVGNRLYAVWFKAANKSLVWYDVGAYERAGVVPPGSLTGLEEVARRIGASGTPAFSLGAADGWTLTDWFENVYLRTAGAARYDQLAQHRLPWTDDSVKQALTEMKALWAAGGVEGGTAGALATPFEASVVQAFAAPPGAAMVMEGDFVQGVVTARTPSRLGTDVDVFSFPGTGDPRPAVVGGGDAAVVLHASAAAEALLTFLASPAAAAIWAAHGGFVSPNANLDLSVYPDETSRTVARRLVEAGDEFHFDLSDLQPPAFGAFEGRGLRARFQELLAGADVDRVASELEADATAAYGAGG